MRTNSILDLFSERELAEFREKADGSLVGPCPSCGKADTKYECIINPDTDTMHCFRTNITFDMLDTAAIKMHMMKCREGRR